MADEDTPKTSTDSEPQPKKIRFHYLKNNAFRTIHADGVFGGVTPRLSISATFFNERHPLPDQTVQLISAEGVVGDEILEERIVRDGLVRELEANVVMDLACAKTVVKWLTDKIDIIERIIKEAEATKPEREEQSDAVIG